MMRRPFILNRCSASFRRAAMLLLAAGIWVAGGLPAAANDEAAQAVTTDSSIEEADLMLDRGDSLLTLNKPVAALSMYRGAVERTFDPCQQARAQVGIAQIYTDSNNPNLALAALEQAQRGFLACEAELRTRIVVQAADLWLQLHFEDRAIALIQRELDLNPGCTQLNSKLADLWFTGGHWEKARAQYAECIRLCPKQAHDLRADWIGAIIQIDGVQGRAPGDSLRDQFEQEAAYLAPSVAQGFREQIHLVLSMQGLHMAALQWAQTILDETPATDAARFAVAHLRTANSAQFAHRPLDALIGYHEAIKSARIAGDLTLLSEALRQKGLFEKDRSNHEEALQAFIELDEIQSERLARQPQPSGREARQFEEQVLPAMDPFDVAAFELERAQSSPYRSTSWPWIAGILAIGVIAYARQQRYLRSALHKERRRIIRLRSLVPADRLPGTSPKTVESEIELGTSSLMPSGEFIQTGDGDARSQSIQAFLNELDADLQNRIQFNIKEDVQFSIGPQVRVVLRNLLKGLVDLTAEDRPLALGVEATAKSHWVLQVDSQHTGASKAFEGLFYGKDALASSRWNELHAQLRKLAGKINIERLSPLEERLTLTLPYL
ncbi:MAG: tetratricopeptide repeat protein [Flavobacteriales bacterium]